MSDPSSSDDLESWLKELDTGCHYRETEAYLEPVFRQVRLSSRKTRFEAPILIPEGKFEKLVWRAHNRFVEWLSNGNHRQLEQLESRLPERLETLSEEIQNLTERIDDLMEIRDHFSTLDERFATLDEASESDALPDEMGRYEVSGEVVTFEAVHDATDLFGREVEWPVYKGNSAPLRVAAHARMPLNTLRSERLPKQKARAVGRLRLRILEYLRTRYQMTGVIPQERSEEEFADEIQDSRENAQKRRDESRGGRPPMVSGDWADLNRDEIQDIRDERLNHMLSSRAFHSLTDDGEVRTSWTQIEESIDEDLFSSAAAIRQHVNRSDKIDLEEKKEEVREKLTD